MQLKPDLAQALNNQVNAELSAAHNYLAMAAYFDSIDLPGFAQWFRAQSTEETQHAMKFYDFVVKRDADVTLTSIDAPKQAFSGPIEAIETALAMEQSVSAQIHALYGLASDAKDYAAQSLLNWFLDEQVEEEDSFRNLLIQTRAAQNDPWNLQVLDKELAARQIEPAPA
ncbi:ferritin [Cognatishimia activa]|uniref:ferritin n=1 Tax=Cognatishimia activa TaxID=1715691 RepID=UPI00222F4335|nr:ferritin [Cognatishimia activa]UZD90272.1 ferritin [Cognatishimia activa]